MAENFPVSVSIPQDPGWPDYMGKKAQKLMEENESCVQCVLEAFMDELWIESTLTMRSAGALHGGMLHSWTCGIHTAGLMILGLLMGREKPEHGLDALMPVVMPAQKLMARLTDELGSHLCQDLTGVDFSDLQQAMNFYITGANIRCNERVGQGAREIAAFLQQAQQEEELFRPPQPYGKP